MSDTEIILTGAGAAGAGLLALIRYAIRVWATIRREAALLEQVKTNTLLIARIDTLGETLDTERKHRESVIYRSKS
jgi:malic enzyme